MPASRSFPPTFLWGAATSSYQIEGSPLADNAGMSIWHRFAHTPGRIVGGDTGDVACDHYRRMTEDVALMRSLSLQAYRFSIAWGRVMPEGRGAVNEAGLGFYDRLVDTLLEAGISPMATLYHWDLPAALDDRGGWLNPDIVGWFADYTDAVVRRLDDRVPLWCTINEPWVVAHCGYMDGSFAPGRRSKYEAAIAAHHLLRAHAASVAAYRAAGRHQVGLVVNIEPKHLPEDASAQDRHARDLADAYMNRQFLEPAMLGRYPAELKEVYGDAWPGWSDAQVQALQAPGDFVGLNYYTRAVVRADPDGWPVPARSERQAHAQYTEMNWEVRPQALTETLLWMDQLCGHRPLYVTENGAAYEDPIADMTLPEEQRRVTDPLRIEYLRRHIAAVGDAIAHGADVRGYYAWSLFDNLEWASGFSKRFGLVQVDPQTQERTLKDSARWYASHIAAQPRDLA